MKLVYTGTGAPVRVGDKVRLSDGDLVTVDHIEAPRHAGSTGRVTVAFKCAKTYKGYMEYFPAVIGAAWELDDADISEDQNGPDDEELAYLFGDMSMNG